MGMGRKESCGWQADVLSRLREVCWFASHFPLVPSDKTHRRKAKPDKDFAEAAFNLTELTVVLAVLVVLGVLITLFVIYERRGALLNQCASNLKQLGEAMTMYAQDNNNCLPYAFIKYNDQESTTWDTLIFPYIDEDGSRIVSGSFLDKKHSILRCPADTIEGWGHARRTYSMSKHDMSSSNWPPGPGNNTGVGLWWSSDVSDGNAALANVLSPYTAMPAIQLSMIPAPAGTLLLTDQARPDNIMFNDSYATIGHGDLQFFDPNSRTVNPYHHGKFNFLMVDGHVEALYPDAKPGMWTIQAND